MANKAISHYLLSKGLPALDAFNIQFFLKPKNVRKPSQWVHLFGELSRLALNIHNYPRFHLFSSLVFYHKLLVMLTDCIQIRQFGIGCYEDLTEFREFFISKIDQFYWLWYPRTNDQTN